MASNINTTNINKQYPIPGEDNSTQGFRDNFESIVDNLDTAKNELEDLQDNVARTDKTSDFNSNTIRDTDFLQTTNSVFEIGNSLTDQEVNFANGHYQTVEVGADITLTLSGWPDADRLAKITVGLLSDGSERTVSWAVENAGTLKRNKGFPVQLSDSTYGDSSLSFNFLIGEFPETFVVSSDEDPIVVEFWTADGGETVYANYVGQFV